MLRIMLISLVTVWALGFFVFNLGGLIHILLIPAVVVLVIGLMHGRKMFYRG